MRPALATLALLLAGCEQPAPANNHFEVVVVGPEPVSAQLYLCDRLARSMPWKGDRYEIYLPADCEGAGRIMVRGADGSSTACPIRVVTTKMSAWYRFEAAKGVCVVK